MTTISSRKKMDELLSGPLDRSNFAEVLQHIYDSYANFDQASTYLKSLAAEYEGASDEAKRDMAEKLGVLSLATGDYAEAVNYLETVKTRKTAAHFLARALLEVGREQEALDLLDKGRSGQDDIETDLLLVRAYCRLREPEKAVKLLKGHKPNHDDPAEICCARGWVADAQGEYGEAIEHYEQALQKAPEHAESIFRLAVNCDLNGDDERAVDLYKQCCALRPTFIGPLINLGILYEDQGKYYEAVDCYNRVLAIDPRHKQAHLYLKDAEASLTMYIDVSRSRRLRRVDEFFNLPGEIAGGDQEEGADGLENGVAGVLGAGAEQHPPEADPALAELLSRSVEELELATRARKCMERLSIVTLRELVQHTEEDLLAVPNFGSTSVNEVRTKLSALGLSLKGD